LVGGLARREHEAHRPAAVVDDGVDLGAQPSTGAAEGVILAPLFPPAACGWARTMELSIRCSDPGERSASASNTRSQTPAFAHLLERLDASKNPGPRRPGVIPLGWLDQGGGDGGSARFLRRGRAAGVALGGGCTARARG